MEDYENFPPLVIFKKAVHTCPKSCLLFASLWKIKNKKNQVVIQQKHIKNRFLISTTIFRNNLFNLARVDLLTFSEGMGSFVIDFNSVQHD